MSDPVESLSGGLILAHTQKSLLRPTSEVRWDLESATLRITLYDRSVVSQIIGDRVL